MGFSRLSAHSLKQPKAVLFDWDDTLFDHAAFANDLADLLLKKLSPGSNSTGEQLNREWHINKEAACEKYFSPLTAPEILKEWDKLYKSVPKESFKLLPDAKEVLDNLKTRNIPMAIVSNKSRELVMMELEHLGLTDYFKVIVGRSPDHTKRKPDPTPIVEAVKAMNMEMDNMWFVGDSIDDVMASRTCAFQRFHIHHSEDRRAAIKDHVDPNDPAGNVIYLNSLKEFNDRIIKKILLHAQKMPAMLA